MDQCLDISVITHQSELSKSRKRLRKLRRQRKDSHPLRRRRSVRGRLGSRNPFNGMRPIWKTRRRKWKSRKRRKSENLRGVNRLKPEPYATAKLRMTE